MWYLHSPMCLGHSAGQNSQNLFEIFDLTGISDITLFTLSRSTMIEAGIVAQ